MTTVTVRQSGGAEIVSIPKAIGKALGVHVGSKLELSIVDNRIVLDPVVKSASLEDLLADSPRENFRVTEEDREWIDAKPVGKEY
ncbi:MAG: AbrB/MazE/SpoVT family DNA-binding domain-containing protein [Gammaproteobacteria bacterium]|nr:MAG: AbrB/MazE/SpoVT family DNA-binding domain-containing protein [Gammaproteobacteria bacterium]